MFWAMRVSRLGTCKRVSIWHAYTESLTHLTRASRRPTMISKSVRTGGSATSIVAVPSPLGGVGVGDSTTVGGGVECGAGVRGGVVIWSRRRELVEVLERKGLRTLERGRDVVWVTPRMLVTDGDVLGAKCVGCTGGGPLDYMCGRRCLSRA